MSEAVLTLLKWCLLALLYLFFFRVLQASWSGAVAPVTQRRRGGEAAPASGGGGGGRRSLRRRRSPVAATTLTIVEPTAIAGPAFALEGEISIGRAAGCQVTLDDTYVSQLHARILRSDDGSIVVEDLGSTNGTYLNRQRVTAPVMAAIGDRLQIGSVVMEFR